VTVLFVATRSPWPSVDGGRVLMARTIAGLRARGHAVTVVAPDPDGSATPPPDAVDLRVRLVPVRRRGWAETLIRAPGSRRPLAIERHHHPALSREVAACARAGVDVVHVQQLHAFAHARALAVAGLPIVLRAENVETELWRQTCAHAWWGPAGWWSSPQLRRWEVDALERVGVTAAVSDRDASVLRRLSSLAAIDVVRIPMPPTLPAAPRLAGDPAIVLMASAWPPNRDGAAWFVRRVWPAVAAALPVARLHVFGLPPGAAGGPRIEPHPRPAESVEAFPDGAIAVVPLRIASGANVRILEAWARGLAVVATPLAAAGVDPGDGVAIAVAATPAEFVSAFRRLAADPEERRRAVAAGRAALAAHHDPDTLAAALERVYQRAIAAAPRRGRA
jgi:hypothetical protein